MKLKVALVFYGQPRFVTLPYSAISHKWFLRKVDYHVLGHCWFTEERTTMETSPWSGLGDGLEFSSDAKESILKNFPDAKIIFEQPLKQSKDFGSIEFRNLMSHLTSLNRALALLRQEDIENNYDMVFLSRFDAVLVKVPDLLELPQNKLLLTKEHDSFPDFLIAGSTQHVLAVDALEVLKKFPSTSIPPPAEILKSEAFFSKYTSEEIAFMNAVSRPIRRAGLVMSILYLYIDLLKVRIFSTLSKIRSVFVYK